jgi:FMN phosphatase YigB (HAD superfamily)
LKVEAVVFDLGKVLVDFDYGIAARKLAQKCGRDAAEVRSILEQSPLLQEYESAQIDSNRFYEMFCRASGYCESFEAFAGCFGDIFSEIPEMVAFQEELRRERIPTYLLSNTNEIAIRHVQRNFPFYSNFTGYILSYEQRAMKPDRAIYEAAERISGKAAKQLVFIDDRRENVDGAADLGWHVIHHRDVKETVGKVRDLLRNSG